MQIIKCDFCGKELSQKYYKFVPYKCWGKRYSSEDDSFELCKECACTLEERRMTRDELLSDRA